MKKNNKDNAGVIAPPPLIFAALLTIGLLLQWTFPLNFITSWIPSKLIGSILFILSGLIAVPSFILMIRNKTGIVTHKQTTALVTNGLFKFSRNPLYMSQLVGFSGIAVYFNSLWVLILLPVLYILLYLGVVLREERYLEGKFGDDYMDYKKNVRRWI